MTAAQLIAGLKDIEAGTIPVDCIIDMIPDVINYLKTSAIREQGSRAHKEDLQRMRITKTIETILYDLNITG